MKTWHESGKAAFPLGANEYGGHGSEFGMSLRDYFAAKAMQGMLSNGDWVSNMVNATGQEADEVVGIAAYEIADAMLRERAK